MITVSLQTAYFSNRPKLVVVFLPVKRIMHHHYENLGESDNNLVWKIRLTGKVTSADPVYPSRMATLVPLKTKYPSIFLVQYSVTAKSQCFVTISYLVKEKAITEPQSCSLFPDNHAHFAAVARTFSAIFGVLNHFPVDGHIDVLLLHNVYLIDNTCTCPFGASKTSTSYILSIP